MKWLQTVFLLLLVFNSLCMPAQAEQRFAVREPVLLVYKEVRGQALKLALHQPRGSQDLRPAVLLLHGGGWTEGNYQWTYDDARRLAALGLVAISVEYRLSSQQLTPLDAMQDVCDAYNWVIGHAQDLNIDTQQIIGHGVSAGAHLVSSLSTVGCGDEHQRVSLAALLLWSPAIDLADDDFFAELLPGGVHAADLSPAEHIYADISPVFIVQGDSDTETPLPGAQEFCGRIQQFNQICEMARYADRGHLLTKNLKRQVGSYRVDKKAYGDALNRQEIFLRTYVLK
jgi:acetyl esterase/lipase